MAKNYREWRMNNWPFDPDKIARLLWVSSPEIVENKRKAVLAVFQSENNLKVVRHPLGELPVLQIGSEYQDGKLLRDTCAGRKIVFRQSEAKLVGFKKGSACLPSLFSCFGGINKFDEDLCAEIIIKGTRYYIPCMEIVRATAGTASFLINTLFSPYALKDYSSIIVNNATVYLFLNKGPENRYPNNAKRNLVFQDYINFIFCTALKEWWEGINTRHLALASGNCVVPVEAFFPDSPDIKIVGFCSPYSNMLWGIQLMNMPDFGHEIEVHDPSDINEESGEESEKETIHKSESTNESAMIDDDETAAASSNSISIKTNAGRYANKPKIRRLKENDAENEKGVNVARPHSGILSGSMDDPLPGGEVPHLEVAAEEQEKLDLPEMIDQVFEALKFLEEKKEVNHLDIQLHQVNHVKYAVMTGTFHSKPFVVMEFDQTDEHALSTLLVRNRNDSWTIRNLALKLVFANGFQWVRAEVEHQISGSYLLRHRAGGRPKAVEARLIAEHLKG